MGLSIVMLVTFFFTLTVHSLVAKTVSSTSHHKVILISLDGATPDFVEQYLKKGVLSRRQGLGLLKREGVYA
ncbi:MAG: hypothetical protein ACYT04_73375, partial [Nostoc sp.]